MPSMASASAPVLLHSCPALSSFLLMTTHCYMKLWIEITPFLPKFLLVTVFHHRNSNSTTVLKHSKLVCIINSINSNREFYTFYAFFFNSLTALIISFNISCNNTPGNDLFFSYFVGLRLFFFFFNLKCSFVYLGSTIIFHSVLWKISCLLAFKVTADNPVVQERDTPLCVCFLFQSWESSLYLPLESIV